MKKLIFYIIAILFYSTDTYSQWYQLPLNINDASYNWLRFINSNTGFVAGFHVLIKTTNGGLNWIINQDLTQYNLKRIYFKNANTGFTFNIDTINASLFRTTNCGESWHNLNVPTFSNAKSILFINEQTGFVFGSKVIILKTINGGNNWFYAYPSYTLNNSSINGSARVNDSTFVGVGSYKLDPESQSMRAIYYSNNAGQNLSLTVILENYLMNDVAFNNSGTGVIGGANYMGRSTNGGLNWTRIYTYYNSGSSISFANETNVYRTSGNIDVSTDAGLSWTMQYSINEAVFCIDMVNTNIGYALGVNGKILKTTNGGFTSVRNINSEIPSSFSLQQNYPNPFNPETIIRFHIKDSRFTNLKVYNILGKEVATLVNEKLQPGTYEVPFSISQFSDKQITSGVYFYKLTTEGFIETKKMLLIK